MAISVAVDGRQSPEVVAHGVRPLLDRHNQIHEHVHVFRALDLVQQVVEIILERPHVVPAGKRLHESPPFGESSGLRRGRLRGRLINHRSKIISGKERLLSKTSPLEGNSGYVRWMQRKWRTS